MPVSGLVLAANYSPALSSLLDELPGVVQAVKVSQFDQEGCLDLYRELGMRAPGLGIRAGLFLHGLGQCLAPGQVDFWSAFDQDALKTALEVTQTQYLSMHLECVVPEDGFQAGVFLRNLCVDVSTLHDLTGLETKLENASVSAPRPGRPESPLALADPSFIKEALSATGSRFVLDVAHAQVSASRLGKEPSAYIRELPLDLVDEVHVSGVALVDGALRDRHVEMDEESYALAGMVLGLARPRTVTLEYGGLGPVFESRSDRDALLRQIKRLERTLRVLPEDYLRPSSMTTPPTMISSTGQ
jgi:uncharacterized protein (UPF0276 family)